MQYYSNLQLQSSKLASLHLKWELLRVLLFNNRQLAKQVCQYRSIYLFKNESKYVIV